MSFVWVGLVLVLVLVLVIPGIGGWRIDEPTSRRNDDSVAIRAGARERASERPRINPGRAVDGLTFIRISNKKTKGRER
jgi:hypothetical protein